MQNVSKRKEAGFALILALLALMLLTFLGLTLAVSTSTELQIATNERWSQQALYNAEAGLEVGKKLLQGMQWSLILPSARTTPSSATCASTQDASLRCWFSAGTLTTVAKHRDPAPWTRNDATGQPSRNYENADCDSQGNGIGYGVVLDDGGAAAPYQNVSTYEAKTLNGTFTLWVRREIVFNQDGSSSDDIGAPDDALVLTAEGTAPFVDATNTTAFASTNRAVRIMEAKLTTGVGTPCGTRGGQVGGGPEGSNFSPCDPITGAAVKAGLGATGTGDDTGVN